MQKLKRIVVMLAAGFLLAAGTVFAQGETEPRVNWNEIIAVAVNSVLVFTLVQLVKTYGPKLSGPVKQALALVGGPLLMMLVQPTLSDLLGYPVDFSTLAAALAGLVSSAAAMASFDHAKLSGGGGA